MNDAESPKQEYTPIMFYAFKKKDNNIAAPSAYTLYATVFPLGFT